MPLSPEEMLEQARATGLPHDAVLDDRLGQELADRGIWWVVLADGTRTAWNGENSMNQEHLACVVCHGEDDKQPDCAACSGTGLILHIPFTDDPWNQVAPFLWVGGHDTNDGEVVVHDEFDLVVSLYKRPGSGPDPGVKQIHFRMADADLDPDHHTDLDAIAEEVVEAIERQERVLVRCHAGLNRSGLVVALALLKIGWNVDDILKRLRHVRSPYALFNTHFVSYLREVEARA